MSNDIFERIENGYATFSKGQKKIADYISSGCKDEFCENVGI